MKDTLRFTRSRRPSQKTRRRSTCRPRVESLEDLLKPAISGTTVTFAAFGDYGSFQRGPRGGQPEPAVKIVEKLVDRRVRKPIDDGDDQARAIQRGHLVTSEPLHLR